MNELTTMQLDYDDLLTNADRVYMDVRFVLHNRFYFDLFAESAKSRILEVQRDLKYVIEKYGIRFSHLQNEDFSVALHLEHNANFDKYVLLGKTVVIIHYYIFVNRLMWRKFGGSIVAGLDYVIPRNNVLDGEYLSTGLWNLGPIYVLEDPWGLFMGYAGYGHQNRNTTVLFRNGVNPIDDLGVPMDHRVYELNIGSIASSNREGGGAKYFSKPNALINPLNYVAVEGELTAQRLLQYVAGVEQANGNWLFVVDFRVHLQLRMTRTANHDPIRMFYTAKFSANDTIGLSATNSAGGQDLSRGKISQNNGKEFSPERPPLARELSSSDTADCLIIDHTMGNEMRQTLVELMNGENTTFINFDNAFEVAGDSNIYRSENYCVPYNKRIHSNNKQALTTPMDAVFDVDVVTSLTFNMNGNFPVVPNGPQNLIGHARVSAGYLQFDCNVYARLYNGPHNNVDTYWLVDPEMREIRNVTYNRADLHLDMNGHFTGLDQDNYDDIASLPWNDVPRYENLPDYVAYPFIKLSNWYSCDIKSRSGLSPLFDNSSPTNLNKNQRLIRVSKNDPVSLSRRVVDTK